MLVHQILKAKSDDGVVTLPEGTTVSEAVEVLSSRKIGAIVISNDGKTPTGIISERDIVRELGRQGAACLVETVGSVMTKNLISCARDDTADQVLAKMTEGRFRHMPVLDADVMIGLISIGDVVKARLSELSMEKDALEGMIMGH
jgi:CBS domain-containing protein